MISQTPTKWLGSKSVAQINRLATIYEPEDIAEMMQVPIERIEEILKGTERARVEVVLYDIPTGRHWVKRSWRAAYLEVCIRGLVDWTWCRSEVFRAWQASREGS